MPILEYKQLADKYNETVALHILIEIEKAAKLAPQHQNADLEARLASAQRLQDMQAAVAA